jgi:hypothetical protein
MTEAEAWIVRPLSVHVPPGERRNPIAMVRLAVGPLEVTLAVSRLKKAGLAVRPPMAEGGTPAISAAPEVWAVIEKAAVNAVAGDPVAREHVLGKLLKRAGGSPSRPGASPP